MVTPTADAVTRMSESKSNELVLVVDAGGTKTASWLVELAPDARNRVLGRGRSSGGNPTSVGFSEATRVIGETVAQARREADRPGGPIARAVLSIAGALDAEIRREFVDWAGSMGLAQQVAVVPDVLPVLAAGTPDCCGVALICGTGSSAFARTAEGRTSLCGGWGYLLGDEGSGYAISRAALRAALDDEESNLPTRPLTTSVLQFFNSMSAREATRSVYGSADPRGTLASVAPLVIQAAEAGDPQAQAVVDAAARDLAALAARAAGCVGLSDRRFALAVTGGVIVSSKRLQTGVQAGLEDMGLACEIGVVEEPLEGCLRLAEPQFSAVAMEWQ
jgi:N-acetylmuramic acid 6-phosphate etherase